MKLTTGELRTIRRLLMNSQQNGVRTSEYDLLDKVNKELDSREYIMCVEEYRPKEYKRRNKNEV